MVYQSTYDCTFVCTLYWFTHVKTIHHRWADSHGLFYQVVWTTTRPQAHILVSPLLLIYKDHALPAAGWEALLTSAEAALLDVEGASVLGWASARLFLEANLLFLSLLKGRQCHLSCDFMWPIPTRFCCSLLKPLRAYQAPPRQPTADLEFHKDNTIG